MEPALSFVEPLPSPDLAAVVQAGITSLIDANTNRAPTINDWKATWGQLVHHRVGGLPLPFVALLDPSAQTSVERYATQVTFLQLSLADSCRTAVATLTAAGIESRVLKGLATSLLDYPVGSVRHTGDVDLLVRPADFERASQLLLAISSDDLKEHEPVDLLVESTFRTSTGIELDLHHRLFRIAGAHDDLLFDRPTPLPDGMGHALSLEARLLHAAGHLMLAPPGHRRLSSLVDVVLLGNNPNLDESVLDDLTNTFGMADLVRFARWLGEAIGSTQPTDPPQWRKTPVNLAHIRTSRSVAWETIAVLQSNDTLTDRLRYVRYQLGKLASR